VALKGNKFLAVGRNLERLAELQRRLVETQQSMERDFLRLRHIEARYRVLFETSPEAVLMVDAHSFRLIEANAGSQALFKDAGKRLVGRDFRECFETESQGEVQSLLRTALATGRIEMCSATLVGSTLPLTVSATVFRQEGGAQFLVRLNKRESAVASHLKLDASLVLSEALEHFPDGWLLTDTSGNVKSVNEEGMALFLNHGIFYEFLPIEQIGETNPSTCLLHEVELGKNYALIISTNGGLWRYNLGDTVQFTSLDPFRIKVTGRVKFFINAFGEEVIVDNADQAIAAACEKTNALVSDYTAAPIFMNADSNGAHEWLIEFEKAPTDLNLFIETLTFRTLQVQVVLLLRPVIRQLH
jgi:PAS domain S-box-containing protein